MAGWWIYLRERFPLPVYALLVGGLSLSGHVLASGGGASAWDGPGVLASFAGLMLFFGVLRLMDELKDYHKDVIAHPDRPLPRGVLSVAQVRRAVHASVGAMFAFGLGIGFWFEWIAGGLYVFLAVYLWLMFKEFYLGERLARRPILYAVTHQVVLLPICMFTVATVRPELAFAPTSIQYGMAVLGSFFAYEVCRKLDPQAHEVLKTYLAMYGAKGASALVVVLTALAAVAALQMGLQWWLWPFEVALLASLTVLFRCPSRYKIVEGVATLSLLFHIWAPTFHHWLERWGLQ